MSRTPRKIFEKKEGREAPLPTAPKFSNFPLTTEEGTYSKEEGGSW